MVTLMAPSWNQIREWLTELGSLARASAHGADQALGPVRETTSTGSPSLPIEVGTASSGDLTERLRQGLPVDRR